MQNNLPPNDHSGLHSQLGELIKYFAEEFHHKKDRRPKQDPTSSLRPDKRVAQQRLVLPCVLARHSRENGSTSKVFFGYQFCK